MRLSLIFMLVGLLISFFFLPVGGAIFIIGLAMNWIGM